LVIVIYDILYIKFINLLIIVINHSYWTLLVRDTSPTSVAMCSLFRLGEVYVANYVLWWCKGRGRVTLVTWQSLCL